MSAGRHSRQTAFGGMPCHQRPHHAYPGAGMPIVAAPSGTGRALAAVTDGGGPTRGRKYPPCLLGNLVSEMAIRRKVEPGHLCPTMP